MHSICRPIGRRSIWHAKWLCAIDYRQQASSPAATWEAILFEAPLMIFVGKALHEYQAMGNEGKHLSVEASTAYLFSSRAKPPLRSAPRVFTAVPVIAWALATRVMIQPYFTFKRRWYRAEAAAKPYLLISTSHVVNSENMHRRNLTLTNSLPQLRSHWRDASGGFRPSLRGAWNGRSTAASLRSIKTLLRRHREASPSSPPAAAEASRHQLILRKRLPIGSAKHRWRFEYWCFIATALEAGYRRRKYDDYYFAHALPMVRLSLMPLPSFEFHREFIIGFRADIWYNYRKAI